MNLIFLPQEIKQRGRGLTFDDVLIVPSRSDVRSRRDPDLKSQVTRNHFLDVPLVSANMDTVTEHQMMFAMNQAGGLGILHRFLSIESQLQEVRRAQQLGVSLCAASIGVNEDFRDRATQLVEGGCRILTIDIAHGHSTTMIDVLKWTKDSFPDVDVIAGNVATAEATVDLIEAGADAIKVGIGPGSMCTTRIITGCGVPQLSAIALASEAARPFGVPVIADGGIRTSGDIVKALAAGAKTVMLGGLLAGTLETPGEIIHGHKVYRGMASKAAQVSWRGQVPPGLAPEGESTQVSIKGHVRDVALELTGGLRSAMSYINAATTPEIFEKAQFIEISANGVSESQAHGLKV